MMAQVVENLDNLISNRELACGQEVSKSTSNRAQAHSQLSKYIAHPREAGSRTDPCVILIATDWDPKARATLETVCPQTVLS